MDYETLEDIMDDLREIHATYCKDWNASFICNCPILQIMNKIYAAQNNDQCLPVNCVVVKRKEG